MNLGLKLFGNKHFEMQLDNGGSEWFRLDVGTRSRQDHGGIFFEVELLGLYLALTVYDARHWNHDEGRWYEPGEEAREWEVSEANLLESGFERRHGLPMAGNAEKALDFYSKTKPVLREEDGISFAVLHVWVEPETGRWTMFDNWTKLSGEVGGMHDVAEWERFLEGKKLY
jgi:hypothetical protein